MAEETLEEHREDNDVPPARLHWDEIKMNEKIRWLRMRRQRRRKQNYFHDNWSAYLQSWRLVFLLHHQQDNFAQPDLYKRGSHRNGHQTEMNQTARRTVQLLHTKKKHTFAECGEVSANTVDAKVIMTKVFSFEYIWECIDQKQGADKKIKSYHKSTTIFSVREVHLFPHKQLTW